MNFLYPLFLFALLAIAIPVLIHFINFKRYKTVYFSNVQLLKLIRQDSKKKSQIKQLLILLSRILTIAALVFAFSRPYIPLSTKNHLSANQVVVVYIDNSFSMKVEGESGPLLEQAKQKAIQIANSYRAGTQFRIITNDFLPQHQLILNKEQFIQQVTEVRESAYSTTLSKVYARAIQTTGNLSKKTEYNVFILSDFQKNSVDFEKVKVDSTQFTYLMPLESRQPNNLMIDSCWFEIPGRKIGQAEKLFIRVSNQSEQAYQNIPVRLTINDSLKAISNISISGNEKTIVELNYTNNSEGIQLCKVELDDYPIIYDNSFFMSYRVQGKLNALGIFNPKDNGSAYLKSLFADDELIVYTDFQEDNLQISQLKNNSCIFLINNSQLSSGLVSELAQFVEDGGTLAVFPEQRPAHTDLNQLLEKLNMSGISNFDTSATRISGIDYHDNLYKNVFKKSENDADLPTIYGSAIFKDEIKKAGKSLLTFRNGKPALTVNSHGDGTVYTFAFPLTKTNFEFVRHIIFVPTVYNIVLQSGERQQYSYSIESDEPIVLKKSVQASEVKTVSQQTGDEYVTPLRPIGNGKQQLVPDGLQKTAGHFTISDGDSIIQAVSFNYSRKESEFSFYTEEDLSKILQSSQFQRFQIIAPTDAALSESIQDYSNGKQLWKFFILMAILFILCEIAIIRFWK